MVSQRSLAIPPAAVMEIMEASTQMEREGYDVIHFEVGEPDFPTPDVIVEAAVQALREGKTRYTHSLGILEFREAIAESYEQKYGVKVSPQQIVVTQGGSVGLLLLFSAILDPGDEVIISSPYWPHYPSFLHYLGATPIFVNVYEEDAFQYRPEEIAKSISNRTKAILINSPANPTGALLSAERMREIASLGPLVVSDEIYHGLVYEGREHSILEFTDRAFVLNGFSKRYAMTGWRLGYIVSPTELLRPIQKMHQNFFISVNSFAQWAGIVALREAHNDVAQMVRTFNERRKLIVSGLRQLGFGISCPPMGAFYVLANAEHLDSNSSRLALDLLREAKVAVTPGISFGSNAEGYLRFSYATSSESIREGLARLKRYAERR